MIIGILPDIYPVLITFCHICFRFFSGDNIIQLNLSPFSPLALLPLPGAGASCWRASPQPGLRPVLLLHEIMKNLQHGFGIEVLTYMVPFSTFLSVHFFF